MSSGTHTGTERGSGTHTKRSLFVCNPFLDKFREVDDLFLAQNDLKKSLLKMETDGNKFEELWEKAQVALEDSRNIENMCGGSGSNALYAFKKCSARDCFIIGRIGQDKPGEQILKHFSDLKVNSLLIKSESQTGTVLNFITPDRERTMVAFVGAAGELSPADIDEEKLQGYDHWHIEGYTFFYKVPEKCIDIALRSHAKISINLPVKNVITGPCFPDFQKASKRVHYIVGNIEEVMALAGIEEKPSLENIQKTCSFFSQEQTIAATDSAHGCYVKASGETEFKFYPSIKIDDKDIISKTGAGDIWSGIFLALLFEVEDIETCVKKANEGAVKWITKQPGTYLPEKIWKTFRL